MADFSILYGPAGLREWNMPGVVDLYGSPNNLSSVGNYDSYIFSVEQADQITDFGFHVSRVSGTASVYVAELVTLDSSGNPSSTRYGGSTGCVFTAAEVSLGWNWKTLGIPATGTAGDIVAAEVRTVTASSTSNIGTSGRTIYESGMPREIVTLTDVDGHPPMAVKYLDGRVQGLPLHNATRLSYDNASDPDEIGGKFTTPISLVCNGAFFEANFDSNAPFALLLYDENDVELRRATVSDEDYVAGAASGVRLHWEDVILEVGKDYRLTLLPTSATNVYLYTLNFVTGTYRYVVPGGMNWQKTQRTDAGSWSDFENDVPWMAVMVKAYTGTSSSIIVTGSSSDVYGYAY